MHVDGRVDEKALTRLVDWHCESGTSAIVAVGTTGESATLSLDEQVRVVEQCLMAADGRVPVIAGTGSNDTRKAMEASKRMHAVGAAAGLCVVPYYNKPSQRGLLAHYEAVAEASPLPQILYNVPGRTVVDMLPETVARLLEHPNIIGIKEATGDVERLKAIQALGVGDACLLSGDDPTALAFMKAGGHGVISVTANVAPKRMSEMCEAALRGDWIAAETLDASMQNLHAAMFVESNPVPVKWALERMGRIDSGLRLPLVALDPEFHPTVEAALRDSGLL
jgi:4-hydroxy-tetrahydrodipicolinate synthase